MPACGARCSDMESLTPEVLDEMRKRVSAWRSGTAHSTSGKIRNAALRRNTAGCHTQRLVTCEYRIEKTCDLHTHRIVTTASIRETKRSRKGMRGKLRILSTA